MTNILNLASLCIGLALCVYLLGRLALGRLISRACPHLMVPTAIRTSNHILWPLAMATFLLTATFGSRVSAFDVSGFFQPWAPTVAALLATISLVQGIDLFVNEVVCRRHDIAMPALVRNIVLGSIYFLIAVAAAIRLFHLDVISFLATSTVASLVLGLALQDTLGNIFAGVSLAVEGAFRAGDWIRVNEVVGKVYEINWRAVQLVTNERVLVSLPNSVVARGVLSNLSRPVPEQCEILRVGAAYSENPTVVSDALLKAAQDVVSILPEPPPQVFLEQFDESAVVYALRFWVIEQGSEREARSALLRNTWFRFKRLGIKIPFPTREYIKMETTMPTQDVIERALASVQLFAELSEEQRLQLSASCSVQNYAIGELVFEEDDTADSFFVVLNGEIELTTKVGGGEARQIGGAGPGDFFGEMALLKMQTRFLRARAIRDSELLKVTSEAFHQLLASSEKMAETISKVMADRLRDRHNKAEQSGVDSPEPRVDAPGVLRWLRDALGFH